MEQITQMDLQPKDVVRCRRYGNRSEANYVIGEVLESDENTIRVMAHREYGAGRDTFMVLEAKTVRVIRNYR